VNCEYVCVCVRARLRGFLGGKLGELGEFWGWGWGRGGS